MYNSDIWEGSLFLSSGLLEHDVVLAPLLALVVKPATTFSRAPNRFDTSSTIFTTLFCDSMREESILSLEGAAMARCIYMFEWVVGRTRNCNHYSALTVHDFADELV